MRTAAVMIMLLVAVALVSASCGKKGPPKPPEEAAMLRGR